MFFLLRPTKVAAMILAMFIATGGHHRRPNQYRYVTIVSAAANNSNNSSSSTSPHRHRHHSIGAYMSSLASLAARQPGYLSKTSSFSPTGTTITTTMRESSMIQSSFLDNHTRRRLSTSLSADAGGKDVSDTNTGRDSDNNNMDFDYFVIGAGSGGIASARRAASYGAKVAVAEVGRLGGTCVNVGCVPKKVMWNAATIAETAHEMGHYGFSGTSTIAFDWNFLKRARDAYIQRLNKIYDLNLDNSNVTKVTGYTSLSGPNEVTVSNDQADQSPVTYTAKHILIATGGVPVFPAGEGIAEHAISSDGFFDLEEMPRKCVVVGAGYIAVELAGVLQALGTETKLVLRKEKALRNFDDMISDALDEEMLRQGIEIFRNTEGVDRIESDSKSGLKTVFLRNGEQIRDVDTVLVAPGRKPNVESLNLDGVGVLQKTGGYIDANEFSDTSVDGIYALGDVVGKVELTPMAIAAGRRLADRLFGGRAFKDAKVSYNLVPTVVFTHPTIGTLGLTEREAIEAYGQDSIKVYQSKFANLYYGPWQVEYEDKPKTSMKLICAGENELVVGLHVIGMGADEMLQGFGVAMKMGATKADFDSTVAIHPTAAEEFVTMFPWGLSPQRTGAIQSPLNGAPPPQP